MWGMKICSNVPGHMTMPKYGEKLKKIFFFETKRPTTLKLGIQHTRVLPMISYDDPGLTLTIFMTGSYLFSECFCMDESLYSIEC